VPKFLPPIGVVGAYRAKRINAATTQTQAAGALVDATSSSSVAGAGSATIAITAAVGTTLEQIRPNMLLVVSDGTGTAEVIQVTSFSETNASHTTGNLTATFAGAHSGTYNLRSITGSDLGPLIVAAPGVSMTLTLFDGHPLIASGPGAGQIIATVPSAFGPGSVRYAAQLQWGLFYSYLGTTAGDLCLNYRTHPV
jgi:hypothetical protein